MDNGVITTETSKSDGRLKAGAGCPHGKKRCLKCAIKNGKGGPGYGTGIKALGRSKLSSAFKVKKLKKLKELKSLVSTSKKSKISRFRKLLN